MAGQFFEAFGRIDAQTGNAAASRGSFGALLRLAWRTLLNLLGLSRRS